MPTVIELYDVLACLFIKKFSRLIAKLICHSPLLNDEFLKPHAHIQCFSIKMLWIKHNKWRMMLLFVIVVTTTGRISLFVVLIKQRDKIIYMKRWHLKLILLKADILISFRESSSLTNVWPQKKSSYKLWEAFYFVRISRSFKNICSHCRSDKFKEKNN